MGIPRGLESSPTPLGVGPEKTQGQITPDQQRWGGDPNVQNANLRPEKESNQRLERAYG
jgi:hypothetical protein